MKICYLADVRSVHTRRWVEYFAKEHEIELITFRGGIYDCMRRIINIGKTKKKLIKGNKNGD